MTKTQKIPEHWKIENCIAIPKNPAPESESEIRVISKTPFICKLYESFVYDWLIKVISPYLDPDQYGMKGLSLTHCLINFLDFIQGSLDKNIPTAVIATLIDMSKAYNRVDHSLLIQDLADMKCPNWLLKIVIFFLENRVLVFSYKGKTTSPRAMPSGAPQGCLLAVIFFIVKFNSALMRPRIERPILSERKAKYMDDTSVAVSINLTTALVIDSEQRARPLKYCERTNQILPKENNPLQWKMNEFEIFTKSNKMKINNTKTKVMKFNRSLKYDFPLEVSFSDKVLLEQVETTKLLGIIIAENVKWDPNTEYICKKARSRIYLLRSMKKCGLTQLIDAYMKETGACMHKT